MEKFSQTYHEFARQHNIQWVGEEAPTWSVGQTWWICSCGTRFYESRSRIQQNARSGRKSCPCPKALRVEVRKETKWAIRKVKRNEEYALRIDNAISGSGLTCLNRNAWDGKLGFEFNWKCSSGHKFTRSITYLKCPFCKGSKPELEIVAFLLEHKIQFEREKRFDTCKRASALPFDFYLPNYNMLIEYQGGAHHGKGIRFDFDMQYRQENDQIKRDWAKANGYRLVEMSGRVVPELTKLLLQPR